MNHDTHGICYHFSRYLKKMMCTRTAHYRASPFLRGIFHRLLSDPCTHIHGLPHIPCAKGIEALDKTSVNARWVSPGKYHDWIISGLTIHSLPAVMIITPISIRYIWQRIDSNINHDVTRWKSPVIILWFTDRWSFFSWYF